MATEVRNKLLEILDELTALAGVRGALIATPHGAFANGDGSGLASAIANDIAKTIRRMTVASATVGAPLDELVINFGPARVMALPLKHEAILVMVLERESTVTPVRSLLTSHLDALRELMDEVDGLEGLSADEDEGPQDEVARLVSGELGPILAEVERRFATYMGRIGKSPEDAANLMREQMREWLLCCNPSPYTFPLLLDNLAQQLTDAPDERAQFVTEVQGAMHTSKLWPGRAIH